MRDRQPLQFEQIAEANRRDHADPGAAALDQRVGRDRAAVGVERIAPGGRIGTQHGADLLDAGQDAFARTRRGAGHLEAMRLAGRRHEHQIGERPSDICSY